MRVNFISIFVIIIAIGIISFIFSYTTIEMHSGTEENNSQKNDFKSVNNFKEFESNQENSKNSSLNNIKDPQCKGNARCIFGTVTRVIDGDTIVVGDKSIRFALVNTPEWGDKNYYPAGNYISNICPVGSKVLVDEDDGQKEGSFGRIIGIIYCNGKILNEEILESGYAEILTRFCSVSEFSNESWAQKFGC